MREFLIIIQFIGIIGLFAQVLYLVNQRPSRQQMRLLVLMIALLINLCGYMFEIQAYTFEQALQATKFSYLGKPISVLALFLFMMDYYKVKLPKWLPVVLAILHIMVILFALTCDMQNLFFSHIEYTTGGVFKHLVFGIGPVIAVYYSLVAVYVILVGAACVRRFYGRIDGENGRNLAAFYLYSDNDLGVGRVYI